MNGAAACDTSSASGMGITPLLADASAETETAAMAEGQPEVRFEDLLSNGESDQEDADPGSAEPLPVIPAPLVSPCPVTWITVLPPLAPQIAAPLPAPPKLPSAREQTTICSTRQDRTAGLEAKSDAPPLAENKLPEFSQAPEPGTEQIAAKLRISRPESSGMPVAQREEMVFTTSSHGENAAAEPQEQALEIECQQASEFVPELAPEPKAVRAMRAAAAESLESAPALMPAASNAARLDREAPDFEPAPLAEAARVTARTLEAIDGHVQLLRSTGQERLEVILKPDAATAIHLEVTRAGGQIQVQARCEHGHFAALDAQWSALQSVLAAQGIRLEPLQASPSLGHPGGQFFAGQHGQQAPRDQAEPPHPFLVEQDMPHPGAAAGRQPRGWPSRGWQRWA